MNEDFEPGNSIGWNFSPFSGIAEQGFVRIYGAGPFNVVQVTEVPAGQRHGVGHKQWVDVETLKGVDRFSGKLFKKK